MVFHNFMKMSQGLLARLDFGNEMPLASQSLLNLDKLAKLELLLVLFAIFRIFSFIGFINWFLHCCSIYLATSVNPVALHICPKPSVVFCCSYSLSTLQVYSLY